MNVGALCGLSAALLCSFLPATRLLTILGNDFLIPFSIKFQQLSKKSGVPRFSIFIVTLITIFIIIIVPRNIIIEFVPLNLCFRMFVMVKNIFKLIKFKCK